MNRITIAIIDDHQQIREAISSCLCKMDFTVIIQVATSAALLRQLEEGPIPQVCLIDYMMPDMRGDELAAILAQKYPSIRLAALTANMSAGCMLDMVGAGCSSFFIKSNSPQEWKDGIEQLVKKGYYFTEWMKERTLAFIQQNASEIKKIR